MLSTNGKTISYTVAWGLILVTFWFLLSGSLKPQLLLFGLLSTLLALVVLRRMDTVDKQPQLPYLNISFFSYLYWLVKQIIFSSIDVTKLVWSNKYTLTPAITKLPVSNIKKDFHVLYANSITLTPGTLCIDIDDNLLTVHALEPQSIYSLNKGEMANRIDLISGDKN